MDTGKHRLKIVILLPLLMGTQLDRMLQPFRLADITILLLLGVWSKEVRMAALRLLIGRARKVT